MLHSCTHTATVGAKGLTSRSTEKITDNTCSTTVHQCITHIIDCRQQRRLSSSTAVNKQPNSSITKPIKEAVCNKVILYSTANSTHYSECYNNSYSYIHCQGMPSRHRFQFSW